MRKILKSLLPPIVYPVVRRIMRRETWSGDYATWEMAQERCTGYDSAVILEQCKASLLKVKNGEAIYERDSILFDKLQYSWGVLAGLEYAAIRSKGKLCVVDFGGSLGSTYYQNKFFLKSLEKLEWCIIEQPHFSNSGKKYFEDDELKFYYSLTECLEKHEPDVLLLSGVLQYLEKPYEWIDEFFKLSIPNIIIDRTAFNESRRDILTIQKVSQNIYEASYPAWFFNEGRFKKKFDDKYIQIGSFSSFCDFPIKLNLRYNAEWKGFIFSMK